MIYFKFLKIKINNKINNKINKILNQIMYMIYIALNNIFKKYLISIVLL